jgi:hypothetical protein
MRMMMMTTMIQESENSVQQNHGRATFLALKHESSIMSDTLHDDAAMNSHLPALGVRGTKSGLRSVPGIIIHPRPPPVLLLVRHIVAPTTTISR